MKNATYKDFEKTAGYICALCGFPAVSTDKMNTLVNFLRDNHGNDSLESLEAAFNSLAAGRLDEKMDSFKSLTGLSASRVLTAYMRERNKSKGTVNEAPDGKNWTTDDTRQIIFNYNGRTVLFNEDVTKEESEMLMRFWINKHFNTYKQNGRNDLLTVGTYDYLMNKGILRIENDRLQKYDGDGYTDLMHWNQVKDLALRLKYTEDGMLNSNKAGFRSMMKKPEGKPMEFAEKRAAVAVYFDSLKSEPF